MYSRIMSKVEHHPTSFFNERDEGEYPNQPIWPLHLLAPTGFAPSVSPLVGHSLASRIAPSQDFHKLTVPYRTLRHPSLREGRHGQLLRIEVIFGFLELFFPLTLSRSCRTHLLQFLAPWTATGRFCFSSKGWLRL